jgi:hypothetical protein
MMLPKPLNSLLRRPVTYAILCTGLVAGWQALTVQSNYQGDWSALFYTGYIQMPPALVHEGTFRIRNDPGFDGQFYHLIAHDPFLRSDTAQYVDNPRFRWRRILLPLLAWLLALGQSDYIDSTYAIAVLGFVFLGAWWLAIYSRRLGLSPAWGLLFPLVPAVLVSIDRFTVDVALAALCVGFAVETRWRFFLVLMLAPLARETGVILPAAAGLSALLQRNRRGVGIAAAALIPYGAWLAYLGGRTGSTGPSYLSAVPFHGLWDHTLHPQSSTNTWIQTAFRLDSLGLLGIWVAVLLSAWLLWNRKHDLCALAAVLFTATCIAFVNYSEAWNGAYAFARTMSPVLIFLGLTGLASRSWMYAAPLVLTIPRIVFQLTPQWHGILRHLKAAIL